MPEISSSLTDKDFPWSAIEIMAVMTFVCQALPPEANIDRATYQKYHVRSSYSVPTVAKK